MAKYKTPIIDQEALQKQHEEELAVLLGTIRHDSGNKKRLRIHQGWWRAFVLGLTEGDYYDKHNKEWKRVCNRTFIETTEKDINFLTPQVIQAARRALKERDKSNPGLIEETRLNFNLLSSQPLCFNFFGELSLDKGFGIKVLRKWWPELTELKKVIFEFAPLERFTNDNSAFDIAFEVTKGNQSGLIGLECKYTDSFSSTEYDKPAYLEIYSKSKSFSSSYEDLKSKRFNQLFRSQLIAEALIQHKRYDFVLTGLFCYDEDESAISTANEFKKKLTNPDDFTLIKYREFIGKVQQLDLDWRQREWTMLLWARYCATILSERVVPKKSKSLKLNSNKG
ncbi:MAG: hypothetical protein WC599_00740 [Bacteroidales bacterium]